MNMLPDHNPSNKEPLQKFNSYHTDLYNKYYGSNINRFFPRYREWAIEVRISHFHKYDDSYTSLISKSLSNLNKNIETRQLKVKQFHDLFSRLDTPNIKLFCHPKGSVYWRFNLFVFQKKKVSVSHKLETCLLQNTNRCCSITTIWFVFWKNMFLFWTKKKKKKTFRRQHPGP